MTGQILSLRDIFNGPWAGLGTALREGLPVPRGFVVPPGAKESDIREAYDDLKILEHTHYVAVRAPARVEIEVIGNDQVIYSLRRIRDEFADADVLVQSMVNAGWCGKASWEGKNIRIRASEGLQCLDPDMYLFNPASGKCTRRTLYQRPRKVFRGVDGTTKTMEIVGERRPLELKYVQAVADLAKQTKTEITWALDHRRVWLISTFS